MKTYDRITDLIGKTPLLKLTNYGKLKELGASIYGKLEYFNPAGSVKDRIIAKISHVRARNCNCLTVFLHQRRCCIFKREV